MIVKALISEGKEQQQQCCAVKWDYYRGGIQILHRFWTRFLSLPKIDRRLSIDRARADSQWNGGYEFQIWGRDGVTGGGAGRGHFE